MGKQILIYKLQEDIEKWNNRIEEKVGKSDFKEWRDFCLAAIENIEGMKVYQLSQQGVDVTGFTVEEINYDD